MVQRPAGDLIGQVTLNSSRKGVVLGASNPIGSMFLQEEALCGDVSPVEFDEGEV